VARSVLFDEFARLARIARWCEAHDVASSEGVDLARAGRADHRSHGLDRRDWLTMVGRTAAAGAAASVLSRVPRALAFGSNDAAVTVGIVGAGLAGLACADQLRSAGIRASVYDANTRTGGRCWSLRGVFPNQVAERGGELIDNWHKTMLGYAQRFNLAIEDVNKEPGDVFYYFNGQHHAESLVVDQFREFVAGMRVDLRRLSRQVTAASPTADDIALDQTSLLAYLEGQNATHLVAGPLLKDVIVQAYVAEYGLEAAEQSCLNFLMFIHADRRSKFAPFGSSDERWHVVDGNDRIVEGLAAAVAGQIDLGMKLVRVRQTPAGAIELTFTRGTQTLVRVHDVVVLAMPFSVLRFVDLDASLGLPAAKQHAIDFLGYGTNAKMMLGFSGRPWIQQGCNGTSYADLPNDQTTWETNPTRANATRAILTDYSGGTRGATLDPTKPQDEAKLFLDDLDKVFPGAAAAATRINSSGDLRVHLEHWPSNPLTQGSYTCYKPGQFTTMAGVEGLPVGNLYFAGEHANSFYEAQGFMEGAALSGAQAASDILRVMKKDKAIA